MLLNVCIVVYLILFSFQTSKKKIDFLKKIEVNLNPSVPPVKLLIRDKV